MLQICVPEIRDAGAEDVDFNKNGSCRKSIEVMGRQRSKEEKKNNVGRSNPSDLSIHRASLWPFC